MDSKKGGIKVLQLVPKEKTYSSSMFAEKLGVNQSTLRNYKTAFSKAGVSFSRENGKTAYTEQHFEMFQTMLKLYEQGQGTIVECVQAVLKNVQSVQADEGQLQDVLKQLEQQGQQLEQHEKQIEAMKKYIDTKLEERDRQLMEVVRDTQEIKAAQQKKSFWQRLKWFFLGK